MLTLFFIGMIYAAFVSLGLPDSLLGCAWPAMWPELGVPAQSAGLISMTVTGCTICASLLSGRLLRRFGTGRVTLVSVMLTAAALAGAAAAPSLGWLWAAAVPLGLGAGAVDTGLNNFVALHYTARHMSWLHCFWGLGATLGPIVLGIFLARPRGWRTGYAVVSAMQWLLVAVLAVTLPLWDRYEDRAALRTAAAQRAAKNSPRAILHRRGVKTALLAFFLYCSAETTTGLWAASYLVQHRAVAAPTAAQWVSLYYLGITAGRFLSGLALAHLRSPTLIRAGQVLSAAGAVLLALPCAPWVSAAALALIGLGFAPVFPTMLHETPRRFGAAVSQTVIGMQMAGAYLGSTLAPALFGALCAQRAVWVLPFFLLVGIAGMTACCERLRDVRAPGGQWL